MQDRLQPFKTPQNRHEPIWVWSTENLFQNFQITIITLADMIQDSFFKVSTVLFSAGFLEERETSAEFFANFEGIE